MNKCKLPPTTRRVAFRTDPEINDRIKNQTIWSVNAHRDSNESKLNDRIKKLDFEWDTERFLETNASLIVLISSILGLKHKKCWFFLTGTVGLFMFQHALHGWCPPLPVIRKMGVRTAEEINKEKMALKIIRGDLTKVVEDTQKNNIEVTAILDSIEKS